LILYDDNETGVPVTFNTFADGTSSHCMPLVDVQSTPSLPTATYLPLPKAKAFTWFLLGVVARIQLVALDVRISRVVYTF
jgi:hypothetical protein